MKIRYPLEKVNGHIIIDINGKRALVDTGCPYTIGEFDSEVFGKVKETNDKAKDILKKTESFLQGRIDAIIGINHLAKYNFTISVKNKEMLVTDEKLAGEGTHVPFDWFHNAVPQITITAYGHTIPVLLDSGAFISYFPYDVVKGLNPVDRKEDFHPILGYFETDLYNIDTEIAGKRILLKGGVLPQRIIDSLPYITNESAFLGTDIFDFFDIDFIINDRQKHLRFRFLS